MISELFSQILRVVAGMNPKTAEVFVGVASLLVSVLIYTVYRKQVALSRLEQRPILHTNRYRVPSSVDRASNPGIVIKLSNYGDGSATTMKGKITIAPVKIEGMDSKLGLLRHWLREKIPTSASAWIRLTAPESDEDVEGATWNQIYGSKIGPKESKEYHIPFLLNTNISIWPDSLSQYWSRLTIWRTQNPHTYGFTSAMTELTDSTNAEGNTSSLENHYRLKIRIEHGNPAGYHGSEPVFDYIIPPDDDQTLNEALTAGRPYEEFRDNPAGYLDDVLVNDSSGG
ncbi:hypothetical protein ACAH01_08805 [Halomicrobium sp. HM KBTZ05]|uniref:hypothetical protein n=1 Tax=Halomicrobium sp. HM KBTZ05 TaxID=3242663 RepID=UPI003557562B